MSDEALNVALVGFGNIGTGVVRSWREGRERLAERAGRRIELTTICDRDLTRDRGVSTEGIRLTSDWNEVVADPSIHVVIELVGGTGIARDVAAGALRAGKHVVTANKALVAAHGAELSELGDRHGGQLLFEASVGAGIPIMRAMQRGLIANEFRELFGILNGTCNFILSTMEDAPGTPFADVLAEAQRLGYAEPDPTLDIRGDDTAHKIAILGSLAFGMDLRPEDVALRGITRIGPEDIELAGARGYTIKLLARACRGGNGAVSLSVAPTLVPREHLLGRVRGVLNALWIEADPIGPTMYYGAGAGQGSTASGILSDVMLVAMAGDVATLRRLHPMRLKRGVRNVAPRSTDGSARLLRIRHARPDKVREALHWPVAGSGHGWIAFDVPALSAAEHEEMLGSLSALGVAEEDMFEARHAETLEGRRAAPSAE